MDNQKIEETLVLVENATMPSVKGKSYRCSCGCNVFTEYKDSKNQRIFECHSCKSRYIGE